LVLRTICDADLFHFVLHGVWVPAFAGTTME